MRKWLKAPMFSPAGFLVRAGVLAVVYAVLTICGVREHMSVLSLTFPDGTPRGLSLFLGVIYFLSYFSFLLLVPILVIASGLFSLFRRLFPQGFRDPQSPAPVPPGGHGGP